MIRPPGVPDRAAIHMITGDPGGGPYYLWIEDAAASSLTREIANPGPVVRLADNAGTHVGMMHGVFGHLVFSVPYLADSDVMYLIRSMVEAHRAASR